MLKMHIQKTVEMAQGAVGEPAGGGEARIMEVMKSMAVTGGAAGRNGSHA